MNLNLTDRWLLDHLPPIFGVVSQAPGAPLASTGFGRPGPTTALTLGIGSALLGFVTRLLWILGRTRINPRKLSPRQLLFLLTGWGGKE